MMGIRYPLVTLCLNGFPDVTDGHRTHQSLDRYLDLRAAKAELDRFDALKDTAQLYFS